VLLVKSGDVCYVTIENLIGTAAGTAPAGVSPTP
jgi:hypothetical protein